MLHCRMVALGFFTSCQLLPALTPHSSLSQQRYKSGYECNLSELCHAKRKGTEQPLLLALPKPCHWGTGARGWMLAWLLVGKIRFAAGFGRLCPAPRGAGSGSPQPATSRGQRRSPAALPAGERHRTRTQQAGGSEQQALLRAVRAAQLLYASKVLFRARWGGHPRGAAQGSSRTGRKHLQPPR